MRKPVLVIRLSTEKPEAVEAGFAKVVGVEKGKLLTAMENVLDEKKEPPKVSPYGDGAAAKRIVKILEQNIL
jgi:UDP-N-acetylglucosamine 2-epimerase (non-hydrolysing)